MSMGGGPGPHQLWMLVPLVLLVGIGMLAGYWLLPVRRNAVGAFQERRASLARENGYPRDGCRSSGDVHHRAHPRGMVLEHVTVEEPITRIVGVEGDFHVLSRHDQDRILPGAEARRPAVA